jgi:hypothetical protein
MALSLTALAQNEVRQSSPVPLDFDGIIRRVEDTQRIARPEASYQVIREYRLYGGQSQECTSQVLAEIQYSPPASETYEIEKRMGSPRGEQVVRKILEHEVVLATGDPESRLATLLTRDNYDFTDLAQQMFFTMEPAGSSGPHSLLKQLEASLRGKRSKPALSLPTCLSRVVSRVR